MDASQREKNDKLSDLYSVEYFPTLLLLDASGRPYAESERAATPKEFADSLKEQADIRVQRDKDLAAADKLEGVEKSKRIIEILSGLPVQQKYVPGFYSEQIQAIKDSDPNDETGFTKYIAGQKAMAGLEAKVEEAYKKQDFDGMITIADEHIKQFEPAGEDLQEVMLIKVAALAEQKKFDEAIALANEIQAIDAQSETGQLMLRAIEHFNQLKKSAE
ncbi:hypothetical protein [Persicirhabdus sediminis]|uniref:Thioredoxin n=1 Tax=Persicirhabdus sediminis TaxID=454144 RepID=A0A8J7MBQ9_9BACT|nr:hypothetical protein [Persicirhabdus sediminis]MBK1790071.1 hypothetical protein [Persicirhabdus sediminis]